MDQCCPTPDQPIIQPDERAIKQRKILKFLYYGQGVVCFIKFLLFGPLAGIFQLINLWVIYTAYATMHFCSVMIYLIMCCFDLLFVTLDWNRLMKQSEDTTVSPFTIFLFSVMVIYYAISVLYTYRIYGHYKTLFFAQHGDVYSQLNDPHHQQQPQPAHNYPRHQGQISASEALYLEQQRTLREQYFARFQNPSQPQQPAQQTQQQQQQLQQDPEESNQANQNVYIQHGNNQALPQAQPVMHDFTNRQGPFKPFAGSGHKIN